MTPTKTERASMAVSSPHGATRFVTDAGSVVLCEESHALPLVHIGLSLRTGSTHDPRGLEGLMRLTSRLLRMGTRKLEPSTVEERIDALGAQLSIGSATSYVHKIGRAHV